MKLAEAKSRITELSEMIVFLRERLQKGPLNSISSALDELNKVAAEKQQLQLALSKAESEIPIAGTYLRDMACLIEAVDDKIRSLNDLKQRDDLPPDIATNVFNQLEAFSKMRNGLKNSVEKAYWQVDLELPTHLGTGPQRIEQGE